MKTHLAANYAIGDPADDMVEIPDEFCAECGLLIAPVVGKVLQGTTIAWDVWAGAYEHVERPEFNHTPIPEEANE